MSRPFLAASIGAALLCSCLDPGRQSPAPPPPESAAEPTPPIDERTAEALESLERGEFERARELVEDLLRGDSLERARAELAAGSPENAMAILARALELAPQDREVRLLEADACVRLAEDAAGGGSRGNGTPDGRADALLTRALATYRSVGETTRSLLGASRAAALLGDREQALELARRAQNLRPARGPSLDGFGESAERLYADQLWNAWLAAETTENEDADALASLTEECLEALGHLLGRESEDPRTWSRLARLQEARGHQEEAADACRRGLKRAPADPELLASWARLVRELEGPAGSVRVLEAHLHAHPDRPAVRWELARARFQLALEGYHRTPPEVDAAPFETLEDDLRALSADAPAFAPQARDLELWCRLARGWCAYEAGALEQAREAFRSTEEVIEHGAERSLPGELESAVRGLEQVAEAFAAADRNLEAGETFGELAALQPSVARWAHASGIQLREAARTLESEAVRLCRAARGRLTNPEALDELRAGIALAGLAPGSSAESAAFRAAADERAMAARSTAEHSGEALRRAAQLQPEDVRMLADAAQVLVYYTHQDLDWAEQALRRAVQLGSSRTEALRAELAHAPSRERARAIESELSALTEAWADAQQHLGVLEWVHRRNAAAARDWIEKALALSPARPPVTNSLLPQIRGELAPEEDDHWDLLSWARPCRP